MNRDREAIARIVDPTVFGLPKINLYRNRYEEAFAKADAILSLTVGGGVEDADLKWLLRLVERQAYTGHCGEENSDIIARQDNDDRIARILAALSPTTLGEES